MIVNFGCGANPAPSTSSSINIDGSLTILLARLPLPAAAFGSRADFVRVIRSSQIRYGTARHLKLPEGSLEGFYASHVLEHLSTRECEDLLRRVRTWLKPSGVLRIVLPDLMRFARSYVAGATEAPKFVANTGLSADGRHRWRFYSVIPSIAGCTMPHRSRRCLLDWTFVRSKNVRWVKAARQP